MFGCLPFPAYCWCHRLHVALALPLQSVHASECIVRYVYIPLDGIFGRVFLWHLIYLLCHTAPVLLLLAGKQLLLLLPSCCGKNARPLSSTAGALACVCQACAKYTPARPVQGMHAPLRRPSFSGLDVTFDFHHHVCVSPSL